MENFRVEKKFVVGKLKDASLIKILLNLGFYKQFPNREISSIYLDTLNYDYVRENINGVSKRKKIRFRWYDDRFDKIFLEEKNKNNFTVSKNVRRINLKTTKNDIFGDIGLFLSTSDIDILKAQNYIIVLKTNYKRSYWISNDKQIRATIDVDVNASNLSYPMSKINLPETILEFKFLPTNETKFRSFFNKNFEHLRSQKYSKYVRSFITLEEAGYKI
tara:strand:+ start:559 stop:1212 length:654 start_codon:yes stop_codon:yes gene_type:complete